MAVDNPSGPSSEETRIGWQLAGLGFEVAGTVAAGAILGWLFDHWRGTDPTGLLVGSLAGLVIGIFTLVRNALRLNRRLEAIDRRRRSRRSPPDTGRARGTDEDDWDRRWREKWDDEDDDTGRE